MTFYIYISSNTPLPCSDIDEQDRKTMCPSIYFTHASMEYFFFEGNFDSEKQCFFSYSRHFSEIKYQVASISRNLPQKNMKCIHQENHKALHELFNYITNHFESSQPKYVEVLFCSKKLAQSPLRQKHFVSVDNFSVWDLFYEELKLLRIQPKLKKIISDRKIA